MSSMRSMDGEDAWQKIRHAANDSRWGDRWMSRGSDGVWCRIRSTPRRCLFTPFRVARGVTSEGEKFELYGDWTKPTDSHRNLNTKWIGYTALVEADYDLLSLHRHHAAHVPRRLLVRKWADLEDD